MKTQVFPHILLGESALGKAAGAEAMSNEAGAQGWMSVCRGGTDPRAMAPGLFHRILSSVSSFPIINGSMGCAVTHLNFGWKCDNSRTFLCSLMITTRPNGRGWTDQVLRRWRTRGWGSPAPLRPTDSLHHLKCLLWSVLCPNHQQVCWPPQLGCFLHLHLYSEEEEAFCFLCKRPYSTLNVEKDPFVMNFTLFIR